MGLSIEQIDTPSAPESLLRELGEFYVVIEAEDMPGDPPTPYDMRIANWRHVSTHFPEFRWVIRDGDGIAGAAVAAFDVNQNLDLGFGRIHIDPEKRLRGYGRALATPLLDHLESHGRTRFETWIKDDTPAEQLAAKVGLKAVYGEKRSRLTIDDLDTEMMDLWIERAAERAADYHLEYFQSPLPDDVVQKFCDMSLVMNTAPRENMEVDDEILTPEEWREREANSFASKQQLHNLIAVHTPTDEWAGYTQIMSQDLQPDLAWQHDTGVDPAHRNKGLGRWLKASMIKRVAGSYPQLARVDTYNAGSNEPMLNINIEMGFKPVHLSHEWQGDLATVRERLRA